MYRLKLIFKYINQISTLRIKDIKRSQLREYHLYKTYIVNK